MDKSALQKKYRDDLAQFHADECRRLLDGYRHIEHLIGLSSHSLTEGHYCENLLREFLRSVLPRRYSVSTGFIRGVAQKVAFKKVDGTVSEAETVASPELDVLIHDTLDFSPVLSFGDVAIVLPEAVSSVLQVKKALTPSQLTSALENIQRTYWHLTRESRMLVPERVFAGVYAYRQEIPQPEEKPISETYENTFRRIAERYGNHKTLPDVVAVGGDLAIYKYRPDADFDKPERFKCYRTVVDGRDYSLQFLLWALMQKGEYLESKSRVHRFSFPDMLELVAEFEVGRPT